MRTHPRGRIAEQGSWVSPVRWVAGSTSNGCYTAGGPSKLVGFATLTDTRGRVVANPVSEFDGCFDLSGDTSATGVTFPSLLSSTTTALLPDAQGRVSLQLSCGTGSSGCEGTVRARSGRIRLGRLPFTIKEEQSATLTFPTPVPSQAGAVTFTVRTTSGVGPSGPITLDMPR